MFILMKTFPVLFCNDLSVKIKTGVSKNELSEKVVSHYAKAFKSCGTVNVD